VKTVQAAATDGKERFCDIILIDTAGRLHVDVAMMDELRAMRKALGTVHILFVVDAMTGQEAVNVAKSFHAALAIDGVVLTKMDGDSRGGAALSVQHVAQAPIHFVGMGEKLEALEPFHPERLVSRLLDRGDILSLIEKAQDVIDEESLAALEKKFKKNEFDLEDFRTQLKQMKKIGSMGSLMGFIPGAKQMLKNVDMDQAEKGLKKKEAIINSMTRAERRNPKILSGARRLRIANGSGTTPADINRFMKEFEQMKKMMAGLSAGKGLAALKSIFK
jgi:signal recognition particle subunit SRP54